MGENITLDAEGARQRPSKTWKEFVDKDMYDLHLKTSGAID